MQESYHLFLISALVIIPYFVTLFLSKSGLIQQTIHRVTWNYALLVSFLITGIIGLVLAYFIDQKIAIDWYRDYLWLHVEFGIVMALLSIFHIAWHLRYFLAVLRKIDECPSGK